MRCMYLGDALEPISTITCLFSILVSPFLLPYIIPLMLISSSLSFSLENILLFYSILEKHQWREIVSFKGEVPEHRFCHTAVLIYENTTTNNTNINTTNNNNTASPTTGGRMLIFGGM